MAMSTTTTQTNRHWLDRLSVTGLRRIMNLWGPFLGAGIRIKTISPDYRYIEVILKLHWYNKNYVATHFGGAMFTMTDPFYMLMLIKNLGSQYIVWDKATTIEFKKPGRGTLRAIFTFSEEELQAIKRGADENEKYIFERPIDILDEQNEVVASAKKLIYVRRRESKKS